MAKRENYDAAKKLIEGAKRILKDAWATADLNALGKPGFLEGAADLIPVRKLKSARRRIGGQFDLFIAVDCSSFSRMPPEVEPVAKGLKCICIDHHVTNDGSFGDVQIVDPEASSAGEIVWRFAKWMEWKLDRASAEALWVAMITAGSRTTRRASAPCVRLAISSSTASAPLS